MGNPEITKKTLNSALPSSFRDPSGCVFLRQGEVFRAVSSSYKDHYDYLMTSGLYDELSQAGLLIKHDEVALQDSPFKAYKFLKPEQVPFISYPYEWSFTQYKDAALVTLEIQKRAIEKGMVLKDASAYNIQFLEGKPVLIDTLSFEKYSKGEPWVAYRQFCQHFFAPLLLMALKDISLGQLMRVHLDGIPLELASKLLPFRTRFSLGVNLHIHVHSRSQNYFADKAVAPGEKKMSLNALKGFVDNLETVLRVTNWRFSKSEWGDYYRNTNYSQAGMNKKVEIIKEWVSQIKPKMLWDLGGNDGTFSRECLNACKQVICFDVDPIAVQRNHMTMKQNGETKILPLLLDLTNPSSGIGWQHEERDSLINRGPCDLALALALIHHLAISNNVPLEKIAELFSKLCRDLIIEFVPKSDSQVQKLLSTRKDIFPNYDEQGFETAFSNYFEIIKKKPVEESERTLYHMSVK